MEIALAIFTIVIGLTNARSIAQDDCPVRDPSLFCERSCTPDTGCRKVGRECKCAGECGWSCIRQGCPSLGVPENGAVTVDSDDRFIGSTAIYTCNDGYILQGTPVRICQENKTWSEGDEVSCECTNNKDEVSRLGRECARPCTSDGTCLRTGHSCICDGICGESCIPVERENYCDPALLSTSHATYTVNPATAKFGSIAQYTCSDGFFPAGGDNERTCTGGGGWSGNALICNPENACYDPPVVEHASHNGSKEYYLAGELLVYSCDFGYYRGNSIPLLMCQQIGDSAAWGNFKMSCSPKSCGYPGNIDHGRIEGSVYSFLSSVTYVCDIGYKILGIATRYCQANQKWSGYLPQCIPVTCRTLSAPEYGKIFGRNNGYNDEVSFTCKDGFILDGASNLRCQHDGTWGSPTPTCKAISEVCHMPQHPLNGQWVTGSNCRDGQYQLRGCQLSYTCNRNYIPVNSSVVYVCSEPEWDKREEPLCEPDACYNPPIVEHASHNGSKEYYFPGEVLFYSCHFGYYGGNSIPLTCEKSSNLATWENFEMTCSPACYDPPVVAYASHNGSKEYYLAGELLVYSCDFGYYRGNSIPLLMCQQAGDTVAWGNLNMTCLPKSCGHPGNIQHGEIEGSAFIFNTSVTYACDRGYKIQGTAIRHCQADQEWSGNLPQCIPVECRNLLAPGDGKIIGSNHSYNDEVSFSCNDGFMLDGESTLRCQHDGTWSSPPPTCNELCSMPKDPTNGRWIKGSNCRDGQYQLRGCQLSYTCNEEYVPVNTSVVYVCSEPEWEQTEEPLCKPDACYDPPVVENASHNGSKEYYWARELLFYTCDDGYYRSEISIPFLMCQKKGNTVAWGDFNMTCLELCSMPKDPTNGRWIKGNNCRDGQYQLQGCQLSYTCNEEYVPVNTSVVYVCSEPEWDQMEEPLCKPDACYDPPPVVENASHNGSKEYYWARELLFYTCDDGYYRSGISIPLLMCQKKGNTVAWGDFDMTCLPKSCGYPGSIDHGRIEGSVFLFRSSVTYVCNNGYKILGNATRHCQANQAWSGESPQCIPTSCGHPGNTENGRIEGTVYSFSRSVTYVCNNGFRIQGNATRHCQANQEWSGDLPQCIPVECRTLSAPENGKIIGSNHGYDDEVSFICNDGFILKGVSNLRCQHDGTWSSPPPTCNTPSSGANTLMTFSDITSTSINVSWPALDQTSDVDFDLIVGYQIQLREAGETDFQAISVGRSLSYLFDNLTEDTEYEFLLLTFWNLTTFEEGLPSSVQSQRTLPKSIPEICSMPQDPINGQWVKGNGCQDGQDQFPECELSYTCNEEYVPANTSVVYVCSGPAWVQREEPLCQPVFLPDTCYDPPVVKKGSHNGSKEYYLPGELLVYTCDFGYYTENAISLLMCNQTGDTVAWGNFDMTCLPKSCEYPDSIENGRIEGSVFIFNSSVTYVCNNGYKILGIATRHCQANQMWSGDLPQCIPVECGILSAPDNGAIAGDNHGYNDEVSFTCNDGFILDGASNLTCQHDGTWSSPTPTCRGACYDPPVVENANHNGTKEYYRAGELLVYACDVGYHKGNSIPLLLCEETGDTVFWGSFRMVCLPLSCGHPGNIEHGRAEGRVYSVRSSVTYVCDIGYKLQGNATRHCQTDQKWSGDLPKCIIIASESCNNSDLPYGLLAEGESNRRGFTLNNDWLRVQCEDNLQLSNGHLLKCENGEWKETTSCDEVCSMPQEPANGQWIKESNCQDGQYQMEGCQLSYTCNEGYVTANTSVVYVCSGTAWDRREEPACRPDACYDPPAVENASHNGSKEYYLPGELLVYTCDVGYHKGNFMSMLMCNQTGDTVSWGNFEMTCIPKSCGHPGDIQHGIIDGNVFSFGSYVTYVCGVGYTIQGNATRHCQGDQQWSGNLPRCVLDKSTACDNSELPYGLLAEEESQRQGFTPNNDWLRVRCGDNLQLSGGSLLKCESGEWRKTTSCSVISPASCDNSRVPEGYILEESRILQGFTSNNVWVRVRCVGAVQSLGGVITCKLGEWDVYHRPRVMTTK